MKSRFSFLLCLSVLICLGCSKAEVASIIEESRPILEVASDNFVSIDQIQNYANNFRPQSKSNDEPDYTIMPYGELDDTPLVYIVNYGEGDGWQILSSDARTPAVIAEGERGHFSLNEGSPAVRIWMDCMSEDIAAVRKARDDELSFSPEEIAANKQIWYGSSPSKEGDEGYWAVTVSSQEIFYDSLSHMTPHWDQYEPYNAYCPLKSNSSTERAPAGCVAIAASEVLYYLHDIWNIPATMVNYGYCIGNTLSYERYFGGDSSTIWSQMDPGYSSLSADAEALMIGYIGSVIDMTYWNNASFTLPAKIRTQLFSLYGITSSHGNYDVSTVKSNLENNLPVIVTASDYLIPVPPDFDVHCFVIDGYMRTYKQYTYYHYWVPDNPNNPKGHFDPDHMPYITYSQTDPSVIAIKINWGWWSQWDEFNPVNDGWFALTPEWMVTRQGNTYNYNHNVKMIYNIASN
ncbi:MAG: C10 family peptidase [Bacteroidales bacterium]|nr:C10 family peptidase [Bacteroidales bacterium]